MSLYGSRWRRERLSHLSIYPLCVFCEKQGRVTAGQVVDHIEPHKNNVALFWDRRNWQTLCKSCHDKLKQQQERGGYHSVIGLDGWPIDPNHPVNG